MDGAYLNVSRNMNSIQRSIFEFLLAHATYESIGTETYHLAAIGNTGIPIVTKSGSYAFVGFEGGKVPVTMEEGRIVFRIPRIELNFMRMMDLALQLKTPGGNLNIINHLPEATLTKITIDGRTIPVYEYHTQDGATIQIAKNSRIVPPPHSIENMTKTTYRLARLCGYGTERTAQFLSKEGVPKFMGYIRPVLHTINRALGLPNEDQLEISMAIPRVPSKYVTGDGAVLLVNFQGSLWDETKFGPRYPYNILSVGIAKDSRVILSDGTTLSISEALQFEIRDGKIFLKEGSGENFAVVIGNRLITSNSHILFGNTMDIAKRLGIQEHDLTIERRDPTLEDIAMCDYAFFTGNWAGMEEVKFLVGLVDGPQIIPIGKPSDQIEGVKFHEFKETLQSYLEGSFEIQEALTEQGVKDIDERNANFLGRIAIDPRVVATLGIETREIGDEIEREQRRLKKASEDEQPAIERNIEILNAQKDIIAGLSSGSVAPLPEGPIHDQAKEVVFKRLARASSISDRGIHIPNDSPFAEAVIGRDSFGTGGERSDYLRQRLSEGGVKLRNHEVTRRPMLTK